MSIPIPASSPTIKPAQPETTYDRWGIVSQTVQVEESGRIALYATITKGNATQYSPLPGDTVQIADPDFQVTAAGDAILGPLLQQRVAVDLQIAKRVLEMRGLI